ncbi:MAG: RNA 2',3'-cyclic phosphodiesterase [Gammaproteobacteria bacterium]|nr:MAG: RNA 2',3'-cyclic phosphodiesterase [Gammaproteobacteria bacterium]
MEIVGGTTGRSRTIRLFFALWPSEAMQKTLRQISEGVIVGDGGRAVPQKNIHMTLHFLGDVSIDVMPCLEQAASRVSARPFELTVDLLEYRQRLQMLWAMPADTPAALYQLVEDLYHELSGCDIKLEPRRYLAHMTLMRKLYTMPALPDIPAVRWQVNDFCLVESDTKCQGVVYKVLRRWVL